MYTLHSLTNAHLRYDGVFVLVTIDQNGTVSYYISYVHSESFPHFRGPGIIKPNHIQL